MPACARSCSNGATRGMMRRRSGVGWAKAHAEPLLRLPLARAPCPRVKRCRVDRRVGTARKSAPLPTLPDFTFRQKFLDQARAFRGLLDLQQMAGAGDEGIVVAVLGAERVVGLRGRGRAL